MDHETIERMMGTRLARRRIEAGTGLFRQGDPTYALFAVVSGRIRLVRTGDNGSTATVHTARAGQTFAEAALFSDIYHCDALADVATEVAVAPKTAMRSLLARDGTFATAFAAQMARQVQGLRTQIELRNIRSAEDRVMAALALSADAGGKVEVLGTLKAFATEIGLTHEALYRALRRLEDHGRLSRAGTSLVLT